MSKVIYPEELKEHILSEHEAGISVRELARRYEPTAPRLRSSLISICQKTPLFSNFLGDFQNILDEFRTKDGAAVNLQAIL